MNMKNFKTNVILGGVSLLLGMAVWVTIVIAVDGPILLMVPLGFLIGWNLGKLPALAIRKDWRTRLAPAFRWFGRE